jgi:hypothetical protein
MDHGDSFMVPILLVFDIQANSEVARPVALSYNGELYDLPMAAVFRFRQLIRPLSLPGEIDMPTTDRPARGPDLTRRAFTCQSLQSLTALALIEGMAAQRLFGNDVQPIIDPWFKELHAISKDVADHKIKDVYG